MSARIHTAPLGRLAAAVLVVVLGVSAPAAAGAGEERKELTRLDVLLVEGRQAEADAILTSLAPDIAADERLAFDTIYVLVRHARVREARAQWNLAAPHVKERLAAPGGPHKALLGETLFVQGLLVARDGQRDDALKLLAQADGYGFPPVDSPLMLLAGDSLRQLGEFELAINAYKAYLGQTPTSIPGHLGLATTLYAARQFDEARTELEELIRRAPDTPGAHYLLGSVLVEQNQFEPAKIELERELGDDPRCVACLSRLAHVAYLEGRNDECRALLARAAAADPADVETRMIAGLLAYREGEYQAAVDSLVFVVARAPGSMAARYQLAMAYRRVGDEAKAREQLDAYQQLLEEQKKRQIGFRGQ